MDVTLEFFASVTLRSPLDDTPVNTPAGWRDATRVSTQNRTSQSYKQEASTAATGSREVPSPSSIARCGEQTAIRCHREPYRLAPPAESYGRCPHGHDRNVVPDLRFS